MGKDGSSLMVTLRVNVVAKGPLLTKDQRPGLDRLVKGIVRELIQVGESKLDERLRPRPAGVYLSVAQAKKGQASTGHFRRSVNSRQRNRTGRIQSNAVYGPWLEGDSPRNATTRFKGYQSFRKTAQELEKESKPLMIRHVNKFIRSIS